MLIEIFEPMSFDVEPTDLDMLLDYSIKLLVDNGHTVQRYDELAYPEEFERVQGLALPVVMADGEILCAGAYDFTLLQTEALKNPSQSKCSMNCNSCAMSKGCSSCLNCPKNQGKSEA